MADTTIVIPCYNEADRLDVDRFVEHALADPPHRFLFVNDGSTDTTCDVLDALHEFDPDRFAVRHLPTNVGKAEAVRQGVCEAMGQHATYVGYWDADLATPLTAIDGFRQRLVERSDLDAIFGARIRMLGRVIDRKPLRHGLGRLFATAASWTLGLGVYDTQCGAKLFRVTETTRALFQQPFLANWIFDVEILARWQQRCRAAGGRGVDERVLEMPLAEWRDVDGSKVRARDFFTAAMELVAIQRRYRLELPAGSVLAETGIPDPALGRPEPQPAKRSLVRR